MLDELRARMLAYLWYHRIGILSVNGPRGAWAMPVHYRPLAGGTGLAVECLLPRWADGGYYLEQDPRVMLVIWDARSPGLRWLQMQGRAQTVPHPDWKRWNLSNLPHMPPEDLYQVVQVSPSRLDLVDEGRGWGARETLELELELDEPAATER